MRSLILPVLMIFSVFNIAAQDRRQAIREFELLKERGKILESQILQPDKPDIDIASKENAEVFRIMPREKYEGNLFATRGSGAYYSFSRKSHSYDETPEIELEQGNLSVGFAGVNYGLIADLGEISLEEINRETRGVEFLAAYHPPSEEPAARLEKRKANGFEEAGVNYKRSLPAVINHTYVLRAVTYSHADILVAFKVYRKDFDESLIIFWKPIEKFEKPVLARSE